MEKKERERGERKLRGPAKRTELPLVERVQQRAAADEALIKTCKIRKRRTLLGKKLNCIRALTTHGSRVKNRTRGRALLAREKALPSEMRPEGERQEEEEA